MKPIRLAQTPMERVHEALVERGNFDTVQEAMTYNVNERDEELVMDSLLETTAHPEDFDVDIETEVVRNRKTGDEFRIVDYSMSLAKDPIIYADRPVSPLAIHELQKDLLQVQVAGFAGTARNCFRFEMEENIRKLVPDLVNVLQITPQAYGEELTVEDPFNIEREIRMMEQDIIGAVVNSVKRMQEKAKFRSVRMMDTAQEAPEQRRFTREDPRLFA